MVKVMKKNHPETLKSLWIFVKKKRESEITFFDELSTSLGSCCTINYINNFGMVHKFDKRSR